jgi:hypothetical protein
MSKIHLKKFSYRFAEQVLNSKLAFKEEIESILTSNDINLDKLGRPDLNAKLNSLFSKCGWECQPMVFGEKGDPSAKMDFLKERIGVEVEFGHSSFIGIDLLKFQISSYSGIDKIDVGVYIVTTRNFQNTMKRDYGANWEGSLNFEKVVKYLPHFKSAIQVPIYVLGLDI